MKFQRIIFFIILLVYTGCKNIEKQMPLETSDIQDFDARAEWMGAPPYSGEHFLKSKLLSLNQTTHSNPSNYTIKEINTEIVLFKHKNDGQVTESVKFLLTRGKVESFVRKISLAGTAEKHYGFKLTSKDVKLSSARVDKNCMEQDLIQSTQPPYICIIVYFQPIEVKDDPILVEIFYDYTSENILRTKDKPFNNQEQENVIQIVYDNYNLDYNINLNNLIIKIEDAYDFDNLQVYPEKYLIKSSIKKNTILWSKVTIAQNSFANFMISIPIFNSKSKLANYMHLQITSTSTITILIWGLTALIVIVYLSYIFLLGGLKRNSEEYDTKYEQEDDDTKPKVNLETTEAFITESNK